MQGGLEGSGVALNLVVAPLYPTCDPLEPSGLSRAEANRYRRKKCITSPSETGGHPCPELGTGSVTIPRIRIGRELL